MNYLLRYAQLLSFTFIIISNSALSSNGKSAATLPSGWEFVPTNSSHLIAITTDVAFNCINLSVGDFIGVFYTNDQGGLSCGGAIEWQPGQNLVVVAYGDDITTIDVKDGFAENEVITWKVFYSQSANEQLIYVDYNSSMPNFNGLFYTNGISMLVSVLNPMEIMADAVPNEVCFGEEVQLSVNISGGCGDVEYSWSSEPVGFVSSQPNPLVFPLENTTYFVTVSNSFGDIKTDVVTVTAKPLPEVNCPLSISACVGDQPILLTGATPIGGAYSGSGVEAVNENYFFNPSIGVGSYLITYCYTDVQTGCENCCEFTFTVNPLPEVLCPDDFIVCIYDEPFALTGSTPEGGIYSGYGVTQGIFDPVVAGAGDHQLTYTFTDGQSGCVNSCKFTITVIEVEVDCPSGFALCIDADPVLLTDGFPEGGIYSGQGVNDNIFNPSVAGAGQHILTYTWSYPGTNCYATCDFVVEVYALPEVNCPLSISACVGDQPVLLTGATPIGGAYSGIGVEAVNENYFFNPSIGVGSYLITYCYTDVQTGCENCCEFTFTVNPLPEVLCPDDFIVCIYDEPIALTGSTPEGGIYSGYGVTQGIFDPVVAGAGDHQLTYTFTDGQSGCVNSCEFTITVIEVEVDCPSGFALCIDADPVLLTDGFPEGGIYSGQGVNDNIFNPSVAGAGQHILTYTWTYPGTNCYATCDFVVEVYALPEVNCPLSISACVGDQPVLLTGATPIGGAYSGIGVEAVNENYFFNPSIGVGSYLITYCYTDVQTGCENCCEFTFTVNPLPEVLCPDDFIVCIYDEPFALTGSTPEGGIYSGYGVTQGIFDPVVAGAGDHQLTYTFTDGQSGCVNSCKFTITVIEVEVDCPSGFALCIDADLVLLTDGFPEGGIYSGQGVNNNIFNPSVAGAGQHILTYTWNYPGTNCYATCDFVVEVYALPEVNCPDDFEVCLGSESLLLNVVYPQGGVYSGDGVVFENEAYYFEPWTGIGDFLVSYCYSDNSTGCSDCCEFIISVKADQLIEIPTGWSGISSNIISENSSLPVLLYPITYPLIILYNFDGIYWPGGNTFTINNWDISSGYVIKSNWDTTLPICGTTIQNSIVQLYKGWNLIPVYTFDDIDVELLFSNVEGFEIATDVAGLGVYWPEYGINTLGNIKSGKAYLVKTNSSGSVSFSR